MPSQPASLSMVAKLPPKLLLEYQGSGHDCGAKPETFVLAAKGTLVPARGPVIRVTMFLESNGSWRSQVPGATQRSQKIAVAVPYPPPYASYLDESIELI